MLERRMPISGAESGARQDDIHGFNDGAGNRIPSKRRRHSTLGNHLHNELRFNLGAESVSQCSELYF